ncbi:hypothetical protein [Bradyrhizobium sp. CCBAU 51753]|uniref:hypothetical protein n=1 Tax=Bradyrhizobium sp. CCBAU 51753 TaxID=1325100 RepID=UPI00188A468C|nr:hypothetical protein [Bradyrhizobium sp. CCBAU 51753]
MQPEDIKMILSSFNVEDCGRRASAAIRRIDDAGIFVGLDGQVRNRPRMIAQDALLNIATANHSAVRLKWRCSRRDRSALPYRLVIKTRCNACALRVQRSSHLHRADFILNAVGNRRIIISQIPQSRWFLSKKKDG